MQALHAQQRYACGSQFDRQRNAVETAADLDDGPRVVGRPSEAGIGSARTFDEQRDGAAVQRVSVVIAQWQCECAEPVHLLAFASDRLLRGQEQPHGGRLRTQPVDQCRQIVGQVFAVVENQQQAALGQQVGQCAQWVSPSGQ
ncbi:MAG: hypothetical protein ABIQ87_11985 [Rubrivivax sp.]